MFTTGKSAPSIVQAKGLAQISDEDALAEIISQILQDNPDSVAEFFSGKEKLKGWFMGQVMRVTRGKADPGLVNKLLSEQLSALRKP